MALTTAQALKMGSPEYLAASYVLTTVLPTVISLARAKGDAESAERVVNSELREVIAQATSAQEIISNIRFLATDSRIAREGARASAEHAAGIGDEAPLTGTDEPTEGTSD